VPARLAALATLALPEFRLAAEAATLLLALPVAEAVPLALPEFRMAAEAVPLVNLAVALVNLAVLLPNTGSVVDVVLVKAVQDAPTALMIPCTSIIP